MERHRSARPSQGEPQSFERIMARLMARRGYGRLLAEANYVEVWRRVSGPLANVSRPGQLKRGVLEIVVANSTILQEMTFQKGQLLEQLIHELPDEKIRDLRFVVGPIT